MGGRKITVMPDTQTGNLRLRELTESQKQSSLVDESKLVDDPGTHSQSKNFYVFTDHSYIF